MIKNEAAVNFLQDKKDWMRNKSLYMMILPVLIFFILFHYKPMYGAIIAFKDYTPALGIDESPWLDWKTFSDSLTVYILAV